MPAARALLAESLPLARELQDPSMLAEELGQLGLLHAAQHDAAAAAADYREAATLLRAQPPSATAQTLLAITLGEWSSVQVVLGQPAEALATLRAQLELALARAEPAALVGVLVGYAHWQRVHESLAAATATLAMLRSQTTLGEDGLRLLAALQPCDKWTGAVPAPLAVADLAEAARAAQAHLAAWAAGQTAES